MLPNLKIEYHDDYLVIHPIQSGAVEGSVTASAISDMLEKYGREEPLHQYIIPAAGDDEKNPYRKFYVSLISADDRRVAGEILARIHQLRPVYDDSNKYWTQGVIHLLGECYLATVQHKQVELITYRRESPVKMSSALDKKEAVDYILKATQTLVLLASFMLEAKDESVTIHRIGD